MLSLLALDMLLLLGIHAKAYHLGFFAMLGLHIFLIIAL
jgi:hypothetical protein